MHSSARENIWWLAVYSRIAVLVLSFASNLIVPDHNATDVFIYRNDDRPEETGIFDKIVYLTFGGLIRWDANYFLHISHYGYTKENMLAFFPLFPFIVRSVASFMYLFVNWFLLYSSVLLIASVLINFLLFIKCSLLLYDLSITILKHGGMAFYAAIIFCVNPASIFFTAPYSETLFSFLTFSSMLHSFRNNFIISSMIAGLSCSARSNGILNLGFVLYSFLIFFIRHFSLSLHYLFSAVVLLIVCIVISLAPFCLFQLYAYVKFCVNDDISSLTLNNVPSLSPWCNDTVPLAYSYVQKQFWNVGFLRYYQLKQIPNFLLALPIMYIILYNCYKKLRNDRYFLRRVFISGISIILEIKNNNLNVINKFNYLVFVIHASALAIFCLLFVHVQISTRMLCSSSPVFYWFIADYFIKNYDDEYSDKFYEKLCHNVANKKCDNQACDNVKRLVVPNYKNMKCYWKMFFCNNNCNVDFFVEQFYIKLYFINYFIIGTVLFSNFYPWT